MYKSFLKLPLLLQVILLLIPGINWITDIIIRGSEFLKKPSLQTLIMLVIAIISLSILGWVDLVWYLLFGKFILI